jgi:hypothetical protein
MYAFTRQQARVRYSRGQYFYPHFTEAWFGKFFLSNLQYLGSAQMADDHALVTGRGLLDPPLCLGDYLRRALRL